MKGLRVSSQIYSDINLEAARKAYEKLANIKILKEDGDRRYLIFDHCRFDEDLTLREFENYLIGLENS